MKKNVFLWQLCGFAFTSLAGTLLHYLFEWSGGSALVALFSGVNESTWEHMKLLFVPMLAFAFVQSLFIKNTESFWCYKLKGMLLGLVIIPTAFYTYNGVFGKSPDWFNIALFFIAALAVYCYEYKLFKSGAKCKIPEIVSFIIILLIASLFVIFTYATPTFPIFKDPIDGTYGYIS